MWDSADWGVFVAVDRGSAERLNLTTYVYVPMSLNGASVSAIGEHMDTVSGVVETIFDSDRELSLFFSRFLTLLSLSLSVCAVFYPGHTRMSTTMTPIVAFNGLVTVQLASGAVTNTVLSTHDALGSAGKLSSEKLARSFKQNILLKRFKVIAR